MVNFGNFTKHPLTTLGGALLGMIQAALLAAAATYTQTGNITDPKPYIAAAGVGAVTFLAGGLLPDPAPKADPPIADPPAPEPAAPAPIIPPEVAQAATQAAFQLLMEKLNPPAVIGQPKTEDKAPDYQPV